MSADCQHCGGDLRDHDWHGCSLERIARALEAQLEREQADEVNDAEFNELLREVILNQRILMSRVSNLEGGTREH